MDRTSGSPLAYFGDRVVAKQKKRMDIVSVQLTPKDKAKLNKVRDTVISSLEGSGLSQDKLLAILEAIEGLDT